MALIAGMALSFTTGMRPLAHELAATQQRPLVRPRVLGSLMLADEASNAQALRNLELGVDDGTLPPGIAARVSFQTGGYKQAGQAEEIKILWDTFKACYPNEELAEEAVNKNSAVILPNRELPMKLNLLSFACQPCSRSGVGFDSRSSQLSYEDHGHI